MPKKDSEVLAFTLRSPWRSTNRITGFRWRPTLISIWLTNPVGWIWPELSEFQESHMRWLASCETDRPWFLPKDANETRSVSDLECLMRGLVFLIACEMRVRLSLKEAERLSRTMLHNPADHHRTNLEYEPLGDPCAFDEASSEWEKAAREHRYEAAERMFSGIAREILKYKRPWYRHPKWQVCQWRIKADFANDLRVFFTDGMGKLRNSESH